MLTTILGSARISNFAENHNVELFERKDEARLDGG